MFNMAFAPLSSDCSALILGQGGARVIPPFGLLRRGGYQSLDEMGAREPRPGFAGCARWDHQGLQGTALSLATALSAREGRALRGARAPIADGIQGQFKQWGRPRTWRTRSTYFGASAAVGRCDGQGLRGAHLGAPATNWFYCSFGGSGEIRTHEQFNPSPVFKTGAFNHSATLPFGFSSMNCIGPIPTLLHRVCKLSATMFINFQEVELYLSLPGMPTTCR